VKGQPVKIHNRAAIRTVKVFLSIISISILTSLALNFIPIHIIISLFCIGLLAGMIYIIYKISLDQIEWEEKYKMREQEWKKIDSERYARKMNHEELKNKE